VKDGIPGSDTPCDIACSGVSSLVAAFCFAITSSLNEEDVAMGAMLSLYGMLFSINSAIAIAEGILRISADKC
jgi:hypothetical protein